MLKSTLIALLLNSSIVLAQVPQVPASINDATKAVSEQKSTATALTEKAMVHINSATPEELAKLPGIGPEKAKAIVAGRPYKSIQDLKNIKGIKEGVFAKIKGLITL